MITTQATQAASAADNFSAHASAGALLLVLAIAAACAPDGPPPNGTPPDGPEAVAIREDIIYLMQDGAGITFSAGDTLADADVRYERLAAGHGDLDFDGDADAAVIIAREERGERLTSLHAVVTQGETAEDVSFRIIGEDLEIRNISISDGVVQLAVVARGNNRPTGSRGYLSVSYMLTTRGIVPVRLDGHARVALPLAEGEGGETAKLHMETWQLDSLTTGEMMAQADSPGFADGAVTLRFVPELVTASGIEGVVLGSTGCNQLVGSYRGETPGMPDAAGQAENGRVATSGMANAGQLHQMTFFRMATTLRSCGDDQAAFEESLVRALNSVRRFVVSDDLGLLSSTGENLLRLSSEDG